MFLWSQLIPAELYECEYGLFRQEILGHSSQLDAFQPQIVFIACDARDVGHLPVLGSAQEEVEALLLQESESWLKVWETARRKWNCAVIQNTFALSGYPALGSFSDRVPSSDSHFIATLNRRLADIAPGYVNFHDVRLLVNEIGARNWFDPRFYLEAKMPCSPESLVAYSHSVAAVILALRGKSRKVLVLDLDNTVWGGVVGDVGVEGIQVGQGSGEGEAFLAFQSFAKALFERGIILAVCSKNDDVRAREPFERRPDMILRLEHFACFRANWSDKPTNLRDIAGTLALGLDSFVFVDDNPAERALVRRTLPEVAVPDLPEDPAGYAQAVSLYRYFETISFTAEDAQRSQYYRENALRSEMAVQGSDMDSFLQSLGMTALCQPVCSLNIQRVTQLLNKSNQFNLTTRRYTQAEIEGIANSPDWATLTIGLRDRCGDNGLISVLLFRRMGTTLLIDTWLMSCRVLQRGVEVFALARAVAIARAFGCSVLEGHFIPSGRNEMVREHYTRLGFAPAASDGATDVFRLGTAGWSEPQTYIREEHPANA